MYEFLKRVPLFASMPDHDLERLCEMVTEIHLKSGDQLFAEGSPGDMAYIIEEGWLKTGLDLWQLAPIPRGGNRDLKGLRDSGAETQDRVVLTQQLLRQIPGSSSSQLLTVGDTAVCDISGPNIRQGPL